MSERHWRLFVEDILECIDKIESYIGNMDFEDFSGDSKTSDAVIRNLEIIGEASNHLPDEVREKHHHIEWRRIIGLRNRIIHEYFGVSLKIAWQIIKNEIPTLREQIRDVLEDKNKQSGEEKDGKDTL